MEEIVNIEIQTNEMYVMEEQIASPTSGHQISHIVKIECQEKCVITRKTHSVGDRGKKKLDVVAEWHRRRPIVRLVKTGNNWLWWSICAALHDM